MSPTYLVPVANHLWQSTLFAGAAGLLTLPLRRNRARVRSWIWMIASLKFLLPLSVLIALGGQVHWRPAPNMTTSNVEVVSVAMDRVSEPFEAPITLLSPAKPSAFGRTPEILLAVWGLGFLVLAVAWAVRWRRIGAAVRAGAPIPMSLPIPVRSSHTTFEPGVFGIFRPVLLLPEGIFFRLTPGQVDAVIAHELCHVRHKDNLAAMLHMCVETAFWFHPLVWWIGKRMVEERERACDEEVVRLGSEPRVYAEGILNVCKLYVESPLVCAAGVTGANLKRRLEGIMSRQSVRDLDFGRKVLLAALGSLAAMVPIAIGVVNAPRLRAQAAASTQSFEVASVKRSPPSNGPLQVRMSGSPGSITYTNVTLKACIQNAYRLKGYQVEVPGPDWISSERYTIAAKASTAVPREQMMPMLQTLLADRFKMTFHRETKVLSGYALVLAKSGSKLKQVKDDDEVATEIGAGSGSGIKFSKATIGQLAGTLSREFNMPVEDSTGLRGFFSFTLEYAPLRVMPPTSGDDRAGDDSTAPSIFAAVQEQLGLKLEPRKTSVEMFVVDHAERPSEN